MGKHPGAWTPLDWSVVVSEFIRPVAGIDFPSGLVQLRAWFSTDEDCLDYLDWFRWADGFVCPGCGGPNGDRVSVGLRRCRDCHRRVPVTAGTVFQGTRTPLTVWFEAAWLMVVAKNGVSALNLSRVLPIGSYQTAWVMLAKYRQAMSGAGKERLSGVVEVDEWYYGGVAQGGSALTGKTLVVGAVERSPRGRGWGRVRFRVVPNRSAWQLRKAVRAMVEPGSQVVTDGLSAYPRALAGYRHQALNESAPDTPNGSTLLPGVHRVFSLADRWLLGTHQGGVQPEHLPEYLDEFAFRWNRRNSRHRGQVFYRLLQHAVNTAPVTYHQLVLIAAQKPEPPTPPGNQKLPGTLQTHNAQRPWRPHTQPTHPKPSTGDGSTRGHDMDSPRT